MNYKKKKRNNNKRNKSKALNSSLQGWTYGRQIAKEVVLRKEFRAFKKSFPHTDSF